MIRQRLSYQVILIGLVFIIIVGCNSLATSIPTATFVPSTTTPTVTLTRISSTQTPVSPTNTLRLPTATLCPSEPLPTTVEDVRELENSLLKTILAEGVGTRLVIEEIKPDRPIKEGGLTIKGSGGSVIMSNVFPGDLTPPDDFLSAQIWRFSGDIQHGNNNEFTFIGEGDTFNLLTFAQIPDIGFVYLRGKGRVVFPDKTEIRLGC
jgi:hypothetical protein